MSLLRYSTSRWRSGSRDEPVDDQAPGTLRAFLARSGLCGPGHRWHWSETACLVARSARLGIGRSGGSGPRPLRSATPVIAELGTDGPAATDPGRHPRLKGDVATTSTWLSSGAHDSLLVGYAAVRHRATTPPRSRRCGRGSRRRRAGPARPILLARPGEPVGPARPTHPELSRVGPPLRRHHPSNAARGVRPDPGQRPRGRRPAARCRGLPRPCRARHRVAGPG